MRISTALSSVLVLFHPCLEVSHDVCVLHSRQDANFAQDAIVLLFAFLCKADLLYRVGDPVDAVFGLVHVSSTPTPNLALFFEIP